MANKSVPAQGVEADDNLHKQEANENRRKALKQLAQMSTVVAVATQFSALAMAKAPKQPKPLNLHGLNPKATKQALRTLHLEITPLLPVIRNDNEEDLNDKLMFRNQKKQQNSRKRLQSF